jgi:hypothetical protein
MASDAALHELIDEARRLSALIDGGVKVLRESAEALAIAERDYRLGKARAWLRVDGDLAREREANVDSATAELRMARDVAEGTRQAALEALRSRRSQLDALRSILSATRADMELAR